MRVGISMLLAVGGLWGGCNAYAQVAKNSDAKSALKPAVRVFWQDADGQLLKAADWGKAGSDFAMQSIAIDGTMPKLDKDKQSFVQMEAIDGFVVTGVRDDQNGEYASGWIAISSNVEEEEHGDHSHWHFHKKPMVLRTLLDANQGNPAHLYAYDNAFYLANDKKNGVTRLDPKGWSKPNTQPSTGQFFAAGGNHITLAAVNGQVLYSTWADRDGENKGRVDVVGISPSNQGKSYSFKLASGGLHGATACNGKVFFAPSEGIAWVNADLNLTQNPNAIEINTVSLGEDAKGKALRTGAFESIGKAVLFTTGQAAEATLCLVDASQPKVSVQKLPMAVAEGLSLTTPRCVRAPNGSLYAFLFSDRRSGEATEALHVVDLDPNKDGSFADATEVKKFTIGPSKIEGHNGHHEVAFSSDGRWAFASMPGSGEIYVIRTTDMEIVSKHSVGGTPTRLACIGG